MTKKTRFKYRCSYSLWPNYKRSLSKNVFHIFRLQVGLAEGQTTYPLELIRKGIHSYPLVGWDGEKGVPDKVGKDPYPGYCAHNGVTFPIWHRPYLLLYEVSYIPVLTGSTIDL